MKVAFVKNGITKTVKSGFSWTTLLFGGLNLMFRGELLVGALVLVGTLFTGGIVQIVYAFFANKNTARRLILDGWMPVNPASVMVRGSLEKWGVA